MTETILTARVSGPSRASARICVAFVLLAALAAIVPWIPYVERIALTVVMVAALVIFMSFRSRTTHFDWFELGIVYGIFFVVSYGLGALWFSYAPGQLFRRSQLEYLTPALAVSTVGFLAFLAGYSTWSGRARAAALVELRPRGVGAMLLIGSIGFAGHVTGAMAGRGEASGYFGILSGIHQLSPFLVIGWFMTWHAVFRERPIKARTLVTVALLGGMAVTVAYLNLGAKEITLRWLGVPAVAYWYAKRRLPVRFLALLLLFAVFVVFPLYNTYRYTARTLDTGTRLERTIDAATEWDPVTYYERTVEAFASRLSYISSTAAVVRDTGRWVDFRYGETLLLAPISLFIPRFVWPDKPEIVIGREFADTFRLVAASDEETQIAASSIGDLYWNFHVAGVIVGMFLMGTFFRWLYRKYGEGRQLDDSFRKGLYVAILAIFWGIEGGVAAGVAGIVRLVVVATLFAFAMERLGLLVRYASPASSAQS